MNALCLPTLTAFASFIAMSAMVANAQEPTTVTGLAKPLRVISYNIKRGLGNDGNTDLERSAKVIRDLRPDFVGLQEVDENTRRSGRVDQPSELGRMLGMHFAFAPFMPYDQGRYGLAILSRFPIEKITEVKLPEGNEPRVAIAARVKLPDGSPMMFVNLHFDWVQDDRFRFAQATTLKKFLNGLAIPYVVVGDFNDGPESRTLQLMSKGTIEAEKPQSDSFTFSATQPSKEIDFIFAAPTSRWQIGEVKVISERIASDHRPVFAEVFRVTE